MQRKSLKALLAAPLAAALCFPAAAAAKDIQIGVTKTKLAAPTCPSGTSIPDCLLLVTQVTMIDAKSDGVAYPTTITTPGVISSFTVGLWKISSNASTQKYWVEQGDSEYGGQPEVRLTVLRRIGKPSADNFRVVAQSPLYALKSYLGKVVELPLVNPIPVTSGEVLAVTSPTWAPILQQNLSSSQFLYQESEVSTNADCAAKKSDPAFIQDLIGEYANYGCTHDGGRPEYSALEITSP